MHIDRGYYFQNFTLLHYSNFPLNSVRGFFREIQQQIYERIKIYKIMLFYYVF